jgi:hypothetical protein
VYYLCTAWPQAYKCSLCSLTSVNYKSFFSMARQPYLGLGLLVSSRFHDHTHLRHNTVGRTPLDEESARRRDLYLTSHNTHKRQTSMPPVGFDPTIPASERPKTHVLDRTATGIGTPSSAEVKERVELSLYSPSGPSWAVLR